MVTIAVPHSEDFPHYEEQVDLCLVGLSADMNDLSNKIISTFVLSDKVYTASALLPLICCVAYPRMQILSVTLTNFKTHKDRQFEFQLGTNAICGENGAGKTSILEAIAWVLFNYQGNYKKEDLIRNGASSAQARVAFISSRDNRTYEVQRSTSGGYILFDPQLNERLPLTRTKDEVLPWLRQHLGVAPGTDLGQLFANTIGVPQGTFTADFLLSTEKR